MKRILKSTLPKEISKLPAPQAKHPRAYKRREVVWAFIFMAPSLLGTAIFFLLPFADTVRRGFFNVRGNTFIGLDAYRSVLNNETFRLAAKNTAKFIAVCMPLLLACSLISALLIKALSKRKGAASGRLFKTGLLLPMALPVAAVALLWTLLFHNNGIINTALGTFGVSPIDFLNSGAAFWVLVITYLWKNTGYDMILWLAGLDGIADEVYEAAKVDGANAWKSFWHISLPGILPTVGLVSVLSLLNSFKVFREAYLVAGAYPHDSMYLLQHLFNNWFQNLDISRLCAAATMLCAVLLIIILPMQRFLKASGE